MPETRALRLAYNTNGLAHHTLDDALDLLADLGYEGVALTLDVVHLHPFEAKAAEVARVRRRLEARGLGCVIETGARFLLDPRRKHHPPLSHDERAVRVRFLERAIEIASDLGAEGVAFFSGVRADGVPEDEAFRRVAAAARGLLDRARVAGVPLGFEPEPGMLIDGLAGFDRLRAAVGEDLRLTLDLGHVACTEAVSIPDAIRASAGALVNVHIEDIRGREHLHRPFGEGDLDFPPILAALHEVAYRGLVSVELSRSSHAAPEMAERSLAFLRDAEVRALG